MSQKIPLQIDDEEILIRFVLDNRHFKNGKPLDKEVFFDKRGVSLQRESYTSERDCKSRALLIPKSEYIGFAVFKKRHFIECRKSFLELNPDFLVDLVYTPMSEDGYLVLTQPINMDEKGNPSHADIFYIDPKPRPDETPNIAIRSFSRKLFKKSCLIVDNNPKDLNVIPFLFKEMISD